ncbi:putative RNA polymerase II ctd phosphatase [Fasciola gigantica]|uniref:Putative RNA polymerase II ctd phosphatase n=1 Tax=Fasciola gigantica TaxID=46835 RepID=A0A504Z0B7_FASGI|nr:putative RNA polymerase II ctd phosphatase [Fasciola gigantica]
MRCGRALTVSVPEHVNGSKTVHWKIKRRQTANPTTVVCVLKSPLHPIININSPGHGWVTALLEDGAAVKSGSELFKFEACEHHVVMKDLCAECGANLRRFVSACLLKVF